MGVATTHPAVDVTCRDAEAYAAWYARRHGLAARGLECGLPLRNEWIRAGKGGDSRSYVHGDRFAPKWVKSRFARTETAIEPVRSFPIDESPYGVYDLMGSASEWSTIEADHPSGQGRLVLGGSWQAYDEREFRIEAARVAAGDSAEATTGFRLVLRRRGERR
jgi:formylglycine-generating enzyme required for sulfatase activity